MHTVPRTSVRITCRVLTSPAILRPQVHAMVQERLARRRFGSEVGQWSGWAGWSECSRSCGGGIRTQSRDCLQKAAADTGTDTGTDR